MITYLLKFTDGPDNWVVYEVKEDLSKERWIKQDNILEREPNEWERLLITDFLESGNYDIDVLTKSEFEELLFMESI